MLDPFPQSYNCLIKIVVFSFSLLYVNPLSCSILTSFREISQNIKKPKEFRTSYKHLFKRPTRKPPNDRFLRNKNQNNNRNNHCHAHRTNQFPEFSSGRISGENLGNGHAEGFGIG